ncbi:hypothetical protein BJ165DRAFT_1534682 [Panaeolus papilionaceus]|nr:hypothetical protein BJ165DRAFT_1534682 [Panaeolus papilionaceus]
MTSQQRLFPQDALEYARHAPITDDYCYSTEAPWGTLFVNTQNFHVIESCWDDWRSAEGQKIQEVLIYGGYRLTAIVWDMKQYAEGAETEGEYTRRLHYMQIGILKELNYFLTFVGMSAARNYIDSIDIPPIMTWLSQGLALRHSADLPAEFNWTMLKEPMFEGWRLPHASWAESWWTDTDFNMANIHDPQNKTRIISDDVIVNCLSVFRQQDVLLTTMAEHKAATEGTQPHSSRRSKWQRPDPSSITQYSTMYELPASHLTDLRSHLKGRRWAPKKADSLPTAGQEYLGHWDARHNGGLRLEERGPAGGHYRQRPSTQPGWFATGWSGTEKAANHVCNDWSAPSPAIPAAHLVQGNHPAYAKWEQDFLPPHGPIHLNRQEPGERRVPVGRRMPDVVITEAATSHSVGKGKAPLHISSNGMDPHKKKRFPSLPATAAPTPTIEPAALVASPAPAEEPKIRFASLAAAAAPTPPAEPATLVARPSTVGEVKKRFASLAAAPERLAEQPELIPSSIVGEPKKRFASLAAAAAPKSLAAAGNSSKAFGTPPTASLIT